MFFGGFIADLPCHVVTLKSAIRSRYGHSKTRSWFVKEVIILDVYLIVIFTPYYDPSPPLWKVVSNSMSSCL